MPYGLRACAHLSLFEEAELARMAKVERILARRIAKRAFNESEAKLIKSSEHKLWTVVEQMDRIRRKPRENDDQLLPKLVEDRDALWNIVGNLRAEAICIQVRHGRWQK